MAVPRWASSLLVAIACSLVVPGIRSIRVHRLTARRLLAARKSASAFPPNSAAPVAAAAGPIRSAEIQHRAATLSSELRSAQGSESVHRVSPRASLLHLEKAAHEDSQTAVMGPPGTMADYMVEAGSSPAATQSPVREAPITLVPDWHDDETDHAWPTQDGQFSGRYWEGDRSTGTLKELLMDIGGGTGASVGAAGSAVDRALLRRMRHQDKLVVLLFAAVYIGALLFCLSLSHKHAQNNSTVTYYADPRVDTLTTDSCDASTFLEVFNQPPKDVQLQVTGLVPTCALPDYLVDTAVTWLGVRYRVAFSFALDLSPWLVREGGGGTREEGQRGAAEGVSVESEEALRQFLAADGPNVVFRNDLSFIELHKEVEWKGWEELATNIKSQIRQSGFRGVVNVHRNGKEILGVHKNRTWANFMHSRSTKVVLALTVFGWILYSPYMWLRHRATTIYCKYRIDVSIGTYWPFIADKIGADGFNLGPAAAAPSSSANSHRRVLRNS